MLVQLQKELGNKWVKIAERMPGRSENGIKNRWNSAKRRKNSKKQKQSAWHRLSGGRKHQNLTNTPAILR